VLGAWAQEQKLMKALLAILLLFVGAVVVVYIAGSIFEQNLHTEIEIDAPPEIVWEHLTDFGEYPTWHPFSKKFSAELLAGSPIYGTSQLPGQEPQEFVFTLLTVEHASELRWKGGLPIPGLFDGEHYFIIEEKPDGNVRFIQGEDFTGVIPLFFFDNFKNDFESNYETVNQALKKLSESKMDSMVPRE